MKKDGRRNKKGETWQEAKRRYNRKYYKKNQDQLKEAQKAREAAKRRAQVLRREKAKKARLQGLVKGREVQRKKQEKWEELGAIVARMNLKAGLSQKEIYRILQGLATKAQISQWIARGKKTVNLKRPNKKSSENG
jgi:hypothetical protein